MHPPFGGVPWEPPRERGFFGATGQNNGVSLLVQHGCKGVWSEVEGDFWCSHFVWGAGKVQFGLEFGHGLCQRLRFIKPSHLQQCEKGMFKACLALGGP